MSEVDPDELPEHGRFDSESEPPEISSVDPAVELGVNMSSHSPNFIQESRVLVTGNSNTTASARYQGSTMGHVLLSGTEPDKGEIFLDAPNPSHLKASYLHRSSFTVCGPWVEGEGYNEKGE